MAGYFGTDTQKRLQARVDEKAEWIASTPGACNSGRVLGCDDIDLLGWPTVKDIMENDGAMGFRLLPRERAGEVGDWMQSRGYRIDFYDPFVGERSEVLNATDRILSEPLPDGLKVGPSPTEPIGPLIEAIQRLMLENGVAPYSGSLLAGAHKPATTAVVPDSSNHGRHSRRLKQPCVGSVRSQAAQHPQPLPSLRLRWRGSSRAIPSRPRSRPPCKCANRFPNLARAGCHPLLRVRRERQRAIAPDGPSLCSETDTFACCRDGRGERSEIHALTASRLATPGLLTATQSCYTPRRSGFNLSRCFSALRRRPDNPLLGTTSIFGALQAIRERSGAASLPMSPMISR